MSFLPDPENITFELALQYINNTNCSLFLTGKAGSGKTTFLRYIRETTQKNCIVVSPTGVAAINAKGVTIHSMFSLPFLPYIRNPKLEHQDKSVSKYNLIRGLKYSLEKLKVFKTLDLLIIDEVSMVRCDMLDAINDILQHVRHNDLPFGGVQMLYVGDMYQLPPVVTHQVKIVLEQYFDDFYFFNSASYHVEQIKHVELKKIYRQSDHKFIEILNNIRLNKMSREDFDFLNSRYIPDFTPPKNKYYITLTTINKTATEINERKLKSLKTKKYIYKAFIKGTFAENMYPCLNELELKVGSQVMFIKNDSSNKKKYFNGKTAVVTKLNEEQIYVKSENETQMEVNMESWDNIKYYTDDAGKVKEETLGSFSQYPLKLAWAITVHKSQGLTFENAILDIASSFKFGQAYVALSRCKSYEGLVLRTSLNENIIYDNKVIETFAKNESEIIDLETELPRKKAEYQHLNFIEKFDFTEILSIISQSMGEVKKPEWIVLEPIVDKTNELQKIGLKFKNILANLLNIGFEKNDYTDYIKRAKDGLKYNADQWIKHILIPMNGLCLLESSQKSTKKNKISLVDIYNAMLEKYLDFYRITFFDEPLNKGMLKKLEEMSELKKINQPKSYTVQEDIDSSNVFIEDIPIETPKTKSPKKKTKTTKNKKK